MPRPERPTSARLRPVHFVLIVLAAASTLAAGGCQQGTATAAGEGERAASTEKTQAVDPAQLLAELAKTYENTKTYEDAGVLRVSVEDEGGQQQNSPPMPFSVAFERPNRLRIHSLQASIVDNGKTLYASSSGLADQVLVQPSPEPLAIDKLFADEMLLQSARGQLDVSMPQLILLVEKNPIEKLVGDGKPELLADAEQDGIECHRVKVVSDRGTAVFWISKKDHLLVKFDFPSEALEKQYHEQYGVAKLSMWAEFEGARLNSPIESEAFAFTVPEGARRLSKLLPPPPQPPQAAPPLLGKKPESFSFVNFKGENVSSESLEGKVVVLDMWATWCGWCFEGFPNLQKVYDQFKDNDKVVILAVNQDDPSMSDEKVKQAFEKAQLTIPIVRDTQHVGDEVLKVEGLPTMVILGPQGTVEDYHVGYDAQLAETLPPKIESLLAGKSLVAEELEKYEQEQKKYEQDLKDYEAELRAAEVADAGDSTAR